MSKTYSMEIRKATLVAEQAAEAVAAAEVALRNAKNFQFLADCRVRDWERMARRSAKEARVVKE